MSLSIVIPFTAASADQALHLAALARGQGRDVVLAGPATSHIEGARSIEVAGGMGSALREALKGSTATISVVLNPTIDLHANDISKVIAPVVSDEADAVFGAHPSSFPRKLPESTVRRLAHTVTGVSLSAPFSGMRAFRTEVLQKLPLRADDEAIDPEILVKLSEQRFRIREVQVQSKAPLHSLAEQLQQARTLLRYFGFANATDNEHEGYNTLARMDAAPRYNAWLGRKFRQDLGRRVLEVGAGIGTITSELEEHVDLLIALEVDEFYVQRLQNLFRGKPHVRPLLSGVERADWLALHEEKLDTVLLSNVLEHVENDAEAIRNFRLALQPGGKLLTFVPALQPLYGSMDAAVGHFRRYSKARLKTLLQANGFAVERLEWVNLVGIPGWFLNSTVLGRRTMPAFQLRLFDVFAPAFAAIESRIELPVGLGLFAVARAI